MESGEMPGIKRNPTAMEFCSDSSMDSSRATLNDNKVCQKIQDNKKHQLRNTQVLLNFFRLTRSK